MGLFGDLIKGAALELGQAFVDGMLEGSENQNENDGGSLDTDTSLKFAEYDLLKEKIAQLSFEEIEKIKYTSSYSQEERIVANDILEERLNYLQNVSSEDFESFEDDELLDYYIESRQKSRHAFGIHQDKILNALFEEIHNRLELYFQYSHSLINEFANYPYEILQGIAQGDARLLPDAAMINVAKATIQRRLDSKNVVSFSDDKFLEEFFCIRKLKEKYMGMSYLNLCEICSEELFDYRSDELLEEFLNMLLNDDYKDLKNASEKKLLKISQLEDEELSYNKYDEFDRILAEFLLNNEEE